MPLSQPLISIITPSLNQSAYLPEAVESVRQQRDAAVEHIIVDGGSTDGTVAWLEANATAAESGQAGPAVRWISEADRGQSDALNKALALATGEIVGWINADDRYEPGAFAAVRQAFARNADAGVVFGNIREIDVEGRALRTVIAREDGVESLVAFWRGATIGQPALFWRRRLGDEIGGFDLSLHYTMDADFWIRARARTAFVHIDAVLADFRVHADAKTADDLATFAEQIELAARHVGLLPAQRRAAVVTELHGQLAELSRQREALARVVEALRRWLERRRARPGRLVIYGAGHNATRLIRRLRGDLTNGGLVVTTVDDENAQGDLSAFGAPGDRDRLIVVTPWRDEPMVRRLESLQMREGRDFVRWSVLGGGRDASSATAAAAEEMATCL